MPKTSDGELKRPKVGAEMPVGRPSWFHVPAPSQGELLSLKALGRVLRFAYPLCSQGLSLCRSERLAAQP